MSTNSKEVQKRADSKRQGNRARNWQGILYPDSAPENWKELIEESCIDVLVSPIHDKDMNAQGELLKPHRHVLMLCSGIKSREAAADIMEAWGVIVQRKPPVPGVLDSFKVENKVHAARYLCHLDSNIGKHRYNPDDVLAFGDIDYNRLIKRKNFLTDKESDSLSWIHEQMKKYDMNAYSYVVDWAKEQGEEIYSLVTGKFSNELTKYAKSINFLMNNGYDYDYNHSYS